MQVPYLPRQVIRNASFASCRLDAETGDIEATRRREALARWRRARADGLTAAQAAAAVGVARATLYRWALRPEPRSRRPRRVRARSWDPRLVSEVRRLLPDGVQPGAPPTGDRDRTFHDLRGTAITRLALAGATVPQIAMVTGHSLRDVESILDAHYLSRDSALGEATIQKLEKHVKRTAAVKRTVKRGGKKPASKS